MSFNLAAFVRDQARAAGIPDEHLSAVVHRAEAARFARDKLWHLAPLRGGSGLTIVGSLDGIAAEIAMADRALGRRVVAAAAVDHRDGVLERRL